MPTFARRVLSGSTDGRPIQISGTAGAITIHTGSTSTNTIDDVFAYAQNNYSEALELKIEFGITGTDTTIIHPVGARQGAEIVIPGLGLKGRSAAGQTVGVFLGGLNGSASVANGLVQVFGYVNRITDP